MKEPLTSYQFQQTYLVPANQYTTVQMHSTALGQAFLFDIEVKQIRGRSDDISVSIMDEKNFNNYKKYWGLSSQQRQYAKIDWYADVRVNVYWSTITFEPQTPGIYNLVLSNIHSAFTSKTVVVKARIQSKGIEGPPLPSHTPMQVNEGAVMVEPGSPWTLGSKIDEIMRSAQSELLIASPYIDNSTFATLATVNDKVRVGLLVSEDLQLSSKVQKRKFTSKQVQSTTAKKRVEVRRIGDLHARFILADKSIFMFLSSDLQTDSLASKYQLGHWTTNPTIVGMAHNYFARLWNDAEVVDFIALLEELEKKNGGNAVQGKPQGH